jgi:hypothetical protein
VRAGISGEKLKEFNDPEKGSVGCGRVRLRLTPWRDAAFCALPTVTL